MSNSLGRLGELLRCCDGVVFATDDHGHLVAARLLQHALQLSHGALHGGPCAQVHLTDDDEDGHFEGHCDAQVLARRSSCGKEEELEKVEDGSLLIFCHNQAANQQ